MRCEAALAPQKPCFHHEQGGSIQAVAPNPVPVVNGGLPAEYRACLLLLGCSLSQQIAECTHPARASAPAGVTFFGQAFAEYSDLSQCGYIALGQFIRLSTSFITAPITSFVCPAQTSTPAATLPSRNLRCLHVFQIGVAAGITLLSSSGS